MASSSKPISLNVGKVDAYVQDNREIVGDLNRVGLNSAEDILSQFYFGRERLLQLVGDIELNTDDNMRIEYSTPLALYATTTNSNVQMLEDAAEIPYGAVQESRLGILATSYAQRDLGWHRALSTITHATRQRPHDLALAEVQTQLFDAAQQPHPVR